MNAVSNDTVAIGSVFSCHATTSVFRIRACLPLLSWTTLVVTMRAPGTTIVSVVPIAWISLGGKCEPVVWDPRTTLAWSVLIAVFVHRVATGLALLLADGTISAGHVPPTSTTSAFCSIFLENL